MKINTALVRNLQKKIDANNRRLAQNKSFIDSILAQNQAGIKSGPIAIASLIPKGK